MNILMKVASIGLLMILSGCAKGVETDCIGMAKNGDVVKVSIDNKANTLTFNGETHDVSKVIRTDSSLTLVSEDYTNNHGDVVFFSVGGDGFQLMQNLAVLNVYYSDTGEVGSRLNLICHRAK